MQEEEEEEEEDHPKNPYTSTRQSDVTFQIIVVTESSGKRRTQSSLHKCMS